MEVNVNIVVRNGILWKSVDFISDWMFEAKSFSLSRARFCGVCVQYIDSDVRRPELRFVNLTEMTRSRI